jgi:drug/metabolite transporter (DMT)-like permease
MDIRAVALSLFVAFLWATNTVIQKYALNNSLNQKTVIVVGSLTYLLCIVFFTIYNYDIIKKDIKKANLNFISLIIIGSILGTFVATLLFLNLLEKHKSSLVTTLTYTAPVFVLLLALLFLKEKITGIQMLGIFVTVIGIVIIYQN